MDREYEYETIERPADGSLRAMSTRELLEDLIGEGQRLFREEVHLAKAEMRIEAKQAGAGAALLGTAGILGLIGGIVFAFALVWLLAIVLPIWGAALIVTGILLLAAAGFALAGRTELKRASPVPRQTLETVKEDKQWARETTRGIRSRMHADA